MPTLDHMHSDDWKNRNGYDPFHAITDMRKVDQVRLRIYQIRLRNLRFTAALLALSWVVFGAWWWWR